MHHQEPMTYRYFSCTVLACQWAVAGGWLGMAVFARHWCIRQQRAGWEDAHCAERCCSCGCHSSRARRLHPKHIRPVARLKISGECFPIAMGILRGRGSRSWCFTCRSDSCRNVPMLPAPGMPGTLPHSYPPLWGCSHSCEYTHSVSSGYLSIIL